MCSRLQCNELEIFLFCLLFIHTGICKDKQIVQYAKQCVATELSNYDLLIFDSG